MFLGSVLELLVTANASSARVLSTLRIEATPSSKTTVLLRATRRLIPEDAILVVTAVKS
jgi:hypothetical protein